MEFGGGKTDFLIWFEAAIRCQKVNVGGNIGILFVKDHSAVVYSVLVIGAFKAANREMPFEYVVFHWGHMDVFWLQFV